MSDLKLLWTDTEADLVVERNDLALTEGLETAVLLSLFTDRRAEESDRLPDGETSRRGWWGDAFPTSPNDKFGSRLWLLGREKQVSTVLDRAREYSREALQWLVDDRVAERVDVTVEVVSPGVLGILVQIYKPRGGVVEYRYNVAWEAQVGA